jgi:kynurenine formamidase
MQNFRHFILFSLLWVAVTVQAESQCQPSKWGADDELGAANYVTPEQVSAAASLIKKGQSHGLGIVIESGMPAFPPRDTQLQIVQPGQEFGRDTTPAYGWHMSYNDDVVQMWLGTGPQLDGLSHLGEAGEFYNCNRGEDFTQITGVTKLSLHNVPPLIGRGVLLDMTEHFGVDAMTGGQPITSSDIKAAAKSQNIRFSQGDVILFHTGWTDAKLEADPQTWGSTIPGLTNEAAAYVASLNPMAVGADTWGVEAVPAIEGDKLFYGHVTLLKKNGIYILETMDTGRLAREDVKEFMFVLGHAKLKGTVQMIINPVAMW